MGRVSRWAVLCNDTLFSHNNMSYNKIPNLGSELFRNASQAQACEEEVQLIVLNKLVKKSDTISTKSFPDQST